MGVFGGGDDVVCGFVQRLFGQGVFARLGHNTQAKTSLGKHGDFASKQYRCSVGLDVGEEKETCFSSPRLVFNEPVGDNVRVRSTFGLAAIGGGRDLPSNEPSKQFLLLADSHARLALNWWNIRSRLGYS